MSRAEALAAALYRRSIKRKREPEGFLEDAPAAALEHPEVWPRLRTLAGWSATPREQPMVATQRRIGADRSDVWLEWPRVATLVIELKPWHPPSDWQLAKYAGPLRMVTAIAGYARPLSPAAPPMLTWGQIRQLRWPDQPLVWSQLHHLIDAVGAAMPNLDDGALASLLPAWDAFAKVDRWLRPAALAVRRELRAGGGAWVLQEGKKRAKLYAGNGYRGYWIWREGQNRDDAPTIFCGLFAGNEKRSFLGDGKAGAPRVPDVRLMVRLDHRSDPAMALWADADFEAHASRWAADGRSAERATSREWWFLLDARAPLSLVIEGADDHSAAFTRWLVGEARAMAALGILGRA